MKLPLSLITLIGSALFVVAAEPSLEKVAAFSRDQVTGIGVSHEERVFVCFPFWSESHSISVAEMIDGKPRPYPSAEWNTNTGDPSKRWVCVQSVVVDDQNALWVLDPASPKIEAVVKGGAKLVKIDLATNQVVQTIAFDDKIAPERSYLNDVRIDTKGGHAFITESGTGAIIVTDLKSGRSRRLLNEHASTKIESDASVVVDGIKLIDPKTGNVPNFQVDGIAYDAKGGWLYYHALAGSTLYRIKTSYLLDEALSPADLAAKVENLGRTPKPDGMLEAADGSVYLTAIEDNAIARFDPATGKTVTIVKEPTLEWPDTMAWGPKDELYVTCSQIHRMPKYNDGESKQLGPYTVFRLKIR